MEVPGILLELDPVEEIEEPDLVEPELVDGAVDVDPVKELLEVDSVGKIDVDNALEDSELEPDAVFEVETSELEVLGVELAVPEEDSELELLVMDSVGDPEEDSELELEIDD